MGNSVFVLSEERAERRALAVVNFEINIQIGLFLFEEKLTSLEIHTLAGFELRNLLQNFQLLVSQLSFSYEKVLQVAEERIEFSSFSFKQGKEVFDTREVLEV